MLSPAGFVLILSGSPYNEKTSVRPGPGTFMMNADRYKKMFD